MLPQIRLTATPPLLQGTRRQLDLLAAPGNDLQILTNAQPDTLTPGGPQGLDRYSYTTNNPVNRIDPTGHRNCQEDDFDYPGSNYSRSSNDTGSGTGGTSISSGSIGEQACSHGSTSGRAGGGGSNCGGASLLESGANTYLNGWTYYNESVTICNNPAVAGMGYSGMGCGYAISWRAAHVGLAIGGIVALSDIVIPGGAVCATNPECEQTIATDITTYYPPNAGFQSEPQEIMLKVGDIISRYGSEAGRYFSPVDVPVWARSLPPDAANTVERIYEVSQPFTVYVG